MWDELPLVANLFDPIGWRAGLLSKLRHRCHPISSGGFGEESYQGLLDLLIFDSS